MSKIETELLLLIGGVFMLVYGLFVKRSWLLYNDRIRPIILGVGLILAAILDIVMH